MDLKDAMQNRRSIRGYLPEPVDQATLKKVLQLATRAVSRTNSQPWQFAVVTGSLLDEIRKDNMDCFCQNMPGNEPSIPFTGIYQERRVGIAKQLLGAMDIRREDTERRNWWTQRGFRFFDAPALIILYMDASLDKAVFNFDMGCVTQNLCLAAMEYGLATCVEEQAVHYERGLRKYLGIHADKRFVIGISIGYADPEFPANAVVTPREAVDKITKWDGF